MITKIQNLVSSVILIFILNGCAESDILINPEIQDEQSIPSPVNSPYIIWTTEGKKGEMGSFSFYFVKHHVHVGRIDIGYGGCIKSIPVNRYLRSYSGDLPIPNNIDRIGISIYDPSGKRIASEALYLEGTTNVEMGWNGTAYEVNVINSGSDEFNVHSEYSWRFENQATGESINKTTNEPRVTYMVPSCEPQNIRLSIKEIGCPGRNTNQVRWLDPFYFIATNYENLTYSEEQLEPFRVRLTARGGDGCEPLYHWLVIEGNNGELVNPNQVVKIHWGRTFDYTFNSGDNYVRLIESSPNISNTPELYVKDYVLSFDSSGQLYYQP